MIDPQLAALASDAGLIEVICSLQATAVTRVFAVTYKSRKLWVKRPESALRFATWLQSVIACLFMLPVLQPPRCHSGPARLLAEANAIRDLEAAGFPVPAIVTCTQQWLVLCDAGQALETKLNSLRDDTEQQWQLIVGAGQLLSRLHAAGLWHGGAQIRNFSLSASNVPVFLDLEDHDLPGMTLAEKQARDIVLFLYSLMRYDRANTPPRLPGLAMLLVSQASLETKAALRKLHRRLAWLLSLGRLIAPYSGRDVRQAVAAGDALAVALAQGEAATDVPPGAG